MKSRRYKQPKAVNGPLVVGEDFPGEYLPHSEDFRRRYLAREEAIPTASTVPMFCLTRTSQPYRRRDRSTTDN